MKYFLYDFTGYNKILFEKINHFLGNEESYILSFADQVGLYRSFPVILPLLIIYCYFAISSVKNDRLLYIDTINLWFKTFSTLFISLFCMLLIIGIMKMAFSFSRPFCTEGLNFVKLLSSAVSNAQCNRSFPSGHTAYSCTMLFSLWQVFNRTTKIIGIFLVIAVTLSRIASGVHFPADLIWGALISFAVVNLVNFILDKTRKYTLPHVVSFVEKKL